MSRPLSISIISWFYIFYALVTLLPKIYILISPEAYEIFENLMTTHKKNEFLSIPLWFQFVFSFLASLVSIIAGGLMLKGYSWGRTLIVVWTLLSLLFVILVSGVLLSFYVKTLIAAIIFILLFRPVANEYFKANGAKNQTK